MKVLLFIFYLLISYFACKFDISQFKWHGTPKANYMSFIFSFYLLIILQLKTHYSGDIIYILKLWLEMTDANYII